ncbi:hypothetical protein SH668x_002820 [Planctomicrobium sp. SH668]|uniref:hypothetical protein n=1 Tax=Planctomicrobium sp. SH668 TaxID=3448126 RepID=UPI003F5BEBB0
MDSPPANAMSTLPMVRSQELQQFWMRFLRSSFTYARTKLLRDFNSGSDEIRDGTSATERDVDSAERHVLSLDRD